MSVPHRRSCSQPRLLARELWRRLSGVPSLRRDEIMKQRGHQGSTSDQLPECCSARPTPGGFDSCARVCHTAHRCPQPWPLQPSDILPELGVRTRAQVHPADIRAAEFGVHAGGGCPPLRCSRQGIPRLRRRHCRQCSRCGGAPRLAARSTGGIARYFIMMFQLGCHMRPVSGRGRDAGFMSACG